MGWGSLAVPGHVSKHHGGAASYHPACWAHRPPRVLGLSRLWSLWASTHLPQGLITWTVQCGLGVQGVPPQFPLGKCKLGTFFRLLGGGGERTWVILCLGVLSFYPALDTFLFP